nr:MAG TPA: hypothetical protein [Caudoviricetes sp.]
MLRQFTIAVQGRGSPWPRLRGPAEALLQRGAVTKKAKKYNCKTQ